MKHSLSKYYRLLLSWFLISVCALLVTVNAQTTPTNNSQNNPYSSGSAQAWMKKMVYAITHLNYQISFVVLKPGVDAQPYLWRHGVNEQGVELEQLSLLNGPGIEMIRIGDQVSYFEPNVPPYSLRSSIINGPFPLAFFNDPARLAASYEFIAVARSRISGRAAQQIRIVSRDRSRYSFNLWLDQETGLLLKLNMVNLKGQLLEQIQVTEFEVTAAVHPYLERVELAKMPPVVSLAQTAESEKNWRINALPVGMEIIKWDVHRLPTNGEVVDYVMLSDGLVDVSVYLQRAGLQAGEEGFVYHNESNTLLTRNLGPLQVTVIGKLPAQTANAIVSSITLVN